MKQIDGSFPLGTEHSTPIGDELSGKCPSKEVKLNKNEENSLILFFLFLIWKEIIVNTENRKYKDREVKTCLTYL